MNKKESRKSKKTLHYSLRLEFTLIFVALVAGTTLLFWLMNNFFLERFYLDEKQSALVQVYESLSDASLAGELKSDDFDIQLITSSSRDSIAVIVMDAESRTIKAYANDTETMIHRMWDNLLASAAGSSESEETEAIDENQIVSIQKSPAEGQSIQIVKENRTGLEYMEMWGLLPDGSLYLLRTALSQIQSSTRIANQFIKYVAMISLAAGVLIAVLLGGRIARPLKELTELSRRMKRLDFAARYHGSDRTEIAELGQNINELAETLEKTILELKSANNELQLDLERREKNELLQREFISDVTHELKTPIALIQGYAEGLQEGMADDPGTRDEYLEVISDEARKMNEMVKKLLTLTSLEYGRSEVTMEHFDIIEVIQNDLKSAALLAERENIRVRTDGIPDEKLLVWSDPFLVEEVFQNYFTNAVHHALPDSGEKVIDIRIESKENCVRVAVFNSGKPIPEESLPRIWDKFYKVDKARTRAYGGSGVGLSIVKAIMELLHQDYGVVNYDNGVEFWFELDRRAVSGRSN